MRVFHGRHVFPAMSILWLKIYIELEVLWGKLTNFTPPPPWKKVFNKNLPITKNQVGRWNSSSYDIGKPQTESIWSKYKSSLGGVTDTKHIQSGALVTYVHLTSDHTSFHSIDIHYMFLSCTNQQLVLNPQWQHLHLMTQHLINERRRRCVPVLNICC